MAVDEPGRDPYTERMGGSGGSMQGKQVVVTGASRGIGLEAAIGLRRMGADLILVCRNPDRAKEAVGKIEVEPGGGKIDLVLGDLSKMDDIRRVARDIDQKAEKIDVLLNNAGAVFTDRMTSADGLELTFATNHINYFLLTMGLMPKLLASAPARIVNVASDAHRSAKLDFDDLQSENGYRGFRTYSRSKLMNVMFTYALARRLEGTGITVNCLHPGVIASNFGRDTGGVFGFLVKAAGPFLASPEDGAKTSLHCATSPEVEGKTGLYFSRSKPKRSNRASYDEAAQERLWKVTESIVGEKFDIAKAG